MSADNAVSRPQSRCSVIYSDGNQCRMSICTEHPTMCYFDARKDAQSRAQSEVFEKIIDPLSGDRLTFPDLSTAIAQSIAALVLGWLDPKTGAVVGYLCQSLVQSLNAEENIRLRALAAAPPSNQSANKNNN